MARQRTNLTHCTYEGCEKVYFCKGFCTKHYSRLRSGKPLAGPSRVPKEIKICGSCPNVATMWGFCGDHYVDKAKAANARLLLEEKREVIMPELGSFEEEEWEKSPGIEKQKSRRCSRCNYKHYNYRLCNKCNRSSIDDIWIFS